LSYGITTSHTQLARTVRKGKKGVKFLPPQVLSAKGCMVSQGEER